MTAQPLSRFTKVAIVLLLLLGTAVALYFLFDEPDPDRPPIIVSSGSVTIVTSSTWTNEGGNKFKEKGKGRRVKSLSATTGTCTTAGKKLVVTYGTSVITLAPKRPWYSIKAHTEIEFPTNATVDSSTAGVLSVGTSDNLASVTNEKGTACTVAGQRIEIEQVH